MGTVKNHLRRAALTIRLAVGALALGAALPAAAQTLASLPGQAAPHAGSGLPALPRASAPAAMFGDAKPVPAWTAFCERYRAECAVDTREPEVIALTPKVWATLNTVNRAVNTAVEPMTDDAHWGVPDRWDLAEDGAGDCEDYQLLKRHRLVEAGLPRRALRMAVVLDENGDGHAVLIARTDRGDLVLDNKTRAILAWHETGYVFIKRESQSATAWVSLGRATSPTLTASP
jgi:predicted transglutaminase-like cysteine proteinase